MSKTGELDKIAALSTKQTNLLVRAVAVSSVQALGHLC